MNDASKSNELPKLRQSNLNKWISKDCTNGRPPREITKPSARASSSSRTLRSQNQTNSNGKCSSKQHNKYETPNPFEKIMLSAGKSKFSSPKTVPKKSNTSPKTKGQCSSQRNGRHQETVTNHPSPSKRKLITRASTRASKKHLNSDEGLPSFSSRQQTSEPSETFKRYGIIIPTADEMLEEQKELDIYRKKVQDALKLDIPKVEFPVTPEKDEPQENLLDCKHLSLEEIENYFNKNVDYLSCIMEGKGNSTRHTRYHSKRDFKNTFTTKHLSYNTSMIVFTFKQIDLMATLMRKQFDPEDVKAAYFFQVLIPELCLKVFMDTHDMTKRSAMDYLDKRPVT